MERAILVLKKDSTSRITDEIVSYIAANLEKLIRRYRITFEYKLVTDAYKDVRKCPTLIYRDTRFEGRKILDFFQNLGQPPHPQQQSPRWELDAYQEKILMDLSGDMADDRQETAIQSAYQTALAQREQRMPQAGRHATPGRFDGLIAKLAPQPGQPGPAQQEEYIPDEDYREDYPEIGDFGAPQDDWHKYAHGVLQDPRNY